MTPKEIQTGVNAWYRTAILAVLEQNADPLDNVSMNDYILGGSTEAQIKGEPEPFAAALLQLVKSGDVLALQVQDDENEDGGSLSAITYNNNKKTVINKKTIKNK